MFTKSFLLKAKKKAYRRNVWYRALDRVERGILDLSCRVVDEVKSTKLASQIVKILAKLRDAYKSGFTKHLENHGMERARKVVEQATKLGCQRAREWLHDLNYIRYLTVIDYNTPYKRY